MGVIVILLTMNRDTYLHDLAGRMAALLMSMLARLR
jgi:hypothetical protein